MLNFLFFSLLYLVGLKHMHKRFPECMLMCYKMTTYVPLLNTIHFVKTL